MVEHLSLRSVKDQQPLQASKWLQLQLLIDSSEMELLLTTLGNFWIFPTGSLVPQGEEAISHKRFLETYSAYVNQLKAGQVPEDTEYQSLFSSVFTSSLDAVYALQGNDTSVMVRPSLPVIQLQMHRLGFSHVDHKFRSMVFGRDSLSWGIQFSYPQLFQNPLTHQILQVDDSHSFPNTALFRSLQKWTRYHTLPTPFLVKGERVNIPVRIGKEVLVWINSHPQLAQHALEIGKVNPSKPA